VPDDTTRAKRDDTPEESRRTRLSRIFDEDAELYDRARPGYPTELYDDLAELAGVRTGSRVLEVGCGTGQATVPPAAGLPDHGRRGGIAHGHDRPSQTWPGPRRWRW
jgi:ubiquinone/menaquinone biosynthesis C-methylase UbiE